MRRWLPPLLIALVLGGLTAAIALGSRAPSNDRDWSEDQERLAVARVEGDRVEIRNVRNFSYAGEKEFVPRWETRGYDL
ncbi:MAG: hypothetical protein LC732_11665, partial [Acidobacteria bacterium]|nr:hypothetical protein [Acidobacteriota bacterium]